jgi:hypothetical protein
MTRSVRQLIALVTAAAALCALPATGWGSPGAVIRDCASDGALDGSYSDADKRAALQQLGPELTEYGDCKGVIASSIGGGGGASSGSSSDGNGTAAASPGKAKKRRPANGNKPKKKARERRATEVALGGRALEPDDPATLTSEDTSNGISTPVVLALIALGLLGAAGVLLVLSKRNPRVADVFRRVSFARFRR